MQRDTRRDPTGAPAPGFTSGTITEAVPVTHGGRTYRVRTGDTVISVAKKHGVSAPALIELNELRGRTSLTPGQILSLPEKNVPPPPAGHTVKPGDTLESIARQHGTSTAALQRANAMGTSVLITVGEVLALSGSGATSARVKPTLPEKLPNIPHSVNGREYPEDVLMAARLNKAQLMRRPSPSRAWVRKTILRLAGEIGVDGPLALAVATQESGLNHRLVSPVNGIGIMQLTPRAGQWASSLIGRRLDILDPENNIVAGLAILRRLLATTDNRSAAVAAYYQGAASIEQTGMAPDTRSFVRTVDILTERYSHNSEVPHGTDP